MKLIIPRKLWNQILSELKARGGGMRESGAFLLAQPTSFTVQSFLCYDDLDPSCLDMGNIIFKKEGYLTLWNYCASEQLRVIADVHTHPSSWISQSTIDQKHPMIDQRGHIALILPNYAQDPKPRKIGAYEYLGRFKWKNLKSSDWRMQ